MRWQVSLHRTHAWLAILGRSLIYDATSTCFDKKHNAIAWWQASLQKGLQVAGIQKLYSQHATYGHHGMISVTGRHALVPDPFGLAWS